MSESFSIDEFMNSASASQEEEVRRPEEENPSDNLDVQKAVVESLAADKAELAEEIASLKSQLEKMKADGEGLKAENEGLKKEIENLRTQLEARQGDEQSAVNKVALYEKKIAEQNEALAKVGDVLAKNAEGEFSNKVALLDRETDLPDRFPGETRDHVLEVVREARDQAERDGRVRKAQLLEGVLVANEPSGNLAKKRAALEKFFNENANIVSGIVMAELDRCGIAYKNGKDANGNDNYLMPAEILRRTY